MQRPPREAPGDDAALLTEFGRHFTQSHRPRTAPRPFPPTGTVARRELAY